MPEKRSSSKREPPWQDGSSPLEWIAAALGALLVVGMLGLLIYEALNESTTPPLIEIAVDEIGEMQSGYVVNFTARNRGETTAVGLVVEGTLRDEFGEEEVSTVTIDYVPSHAEVRAGLFFSQDPRLDSLALRPLGFQTY